MASFPDHFSQLAARYAAFRPHYPPALVDLLAERCARHDVAWDVGCGSGQLSVALAARFTQVIATDPAQAQLDHAVAHPRVAYRCAPAEASGLADASVELAVAAQAAHWFDWPRFVAEAGRVVRPGGLCALVSYGNAEVDRTALPFGSADGQGQAPAVDRTALPFGSADGQGRAPAVDATSALAAFYRVIEPYWPAGRVHVNNRYRDLTLPWPEVAAPALAMTARWTRDELIGYVTTWSATARQVAACGEGALAALRGALAKTWPAEEAREIRWPLTIKLARR